MGRELMDEIYEEYGEFIQAVKDGATDLGSVAEQKRERLLHCIIEISTRIADDIVTERLRECGIIPKD